MAAVLAAGAAAHDPIYSAPHSTRHPQPLHHYTGSINIIIAHTFVSSSRMNVAHILFAYSSISSGTTWRTLNCSINVSRLGDLGSPSARAWLSGWLGGGGEPPTRM